MPHPFSACAEVARSAAGHAEHLGIARPKILEALKLTKANLEDNATTLSDETLEGMLSIMLLRSGTNTLALGRTCENAIFGLGVLGSALSTCESFADALTIAIRCTPLVLNRAWLQLEVNHHSVKVQVHRVTPREVLNRAFSEAVLLNLQRLLQRCAGPDARFASLELGYPSPPHAEDYQRAFTVEPVFGAPVTAFVVPKSVATRRSFYHCSAMHERLRAEAELAVAVNLSGCTASQAVARLLVETPSAHLQSIEAVAKALCMSSRSLRRKLAHEGTSYREIRRNALLHGAQKLLENRIWSIKEVSTRLGFASSRTFTRALREATGRSPSEMRREAARARNQHTDAKA